MKLLQHTSSMCSSQVQLGMHEGRNFLYELGKNRSEMYLYYIFTDDDIELTTELQINPWRTFLDFLLDVTFIHTLTLMSGGQELFPEL